MNTQSNDISELYTVLLDTVKGVKNGTIEVEKAKAVAEVSQVIVNAGKLECEYLKIAEKQSSKFLSDSDTRQPALTEKKEGKHKKLENPDSDSHIPGGGPF